jgi:hypothetical protein
MSSVAISPPPQPTGNILVIFRPSSKPKAVERLVANATGARVAHSRDFPAAGAGIAEAFAEAGALSLDRLGIAVVKAPEGDGMPDAATTLRAHKEVIEVRPEFWMHVIAGWDDRYTAWVRDGLSLLADPALRGALPPGGIATAPFAALLAPQTSATWGLTATGVDRSTFSGAGIKVAVLDTGIDLSHPDFSGRTNVLKASCRARTFRTSRAMARIASALLAGRFRRPNRSAMGWPTKRKSIAAKS